MIRSPLSTSETKSDKNFENTFKKIFRRFPFALN